MVDDQDIQWKLSLVYELHWPCISTWGGRDRLGTAGLNTVPSMVITVSTASRVF